MNNEPDWQEICKDYPHAGILGASENTSILPPELSPFERVIITLVLIALAGVLFTFL